MGAISNLYGFFSGQWQKSPIGFGVSGSLVRSWSETSLSAGTNNVIDPIVPVGELWVITNLTILYGGTPPSSMRIQISVGGVLATIYFIKTVADFVYYDRQGQWILMPGDHLRGRVDGATLNDSLYCQAAGYKIDLDL